MTWPGVFLPEGQDLTVHVALGPVLQFAGFNGPEDVKAAVLSGSERLGVDHLALLLQVGGSMLLLLLLAPCFCGPYCGGSRLCAQAVLDCFRLFHHDCFTSTVKCADCSNHG